MKKQNKKALRVQREIVRDLQLSEPQLKDVVGGTNGCISGLGGTASGCRYCVN